VRSKPTCTGKQVLLWMRGRSKPLGELLDAAPFSVSAKAAAEEAMRAVTGKPLRQCGQEAVGAALRAGGSSADAVAAANGIGTREAAKLLGF
jgi:hypothetical protein